MNDNYTYCVGFGFKSTGQPDICKNCKRRINNLEDNMKLYDFSNIPYDPNTGSCKMFEKINHGNKINN